MGWASLLAASLTPLPPTPPPATRLPARSAVTPPPPAPLTTRPAAPPPWPACSPPGASAGPASGTARRRPEAGRGGGGASIQQGAGWKVRVRGSAGQMSTCCSSHSPRPTGLGARALHPRPPRAPPPTPHPQLPHPHLLQAEPVPLHQRRLGRRAVRCATHLGNHCVHPGGGGCGGVWGRRPCNSQHQTYWSSGIHGGEQTRPLLLTAPVPLHRPHSPPGPAAAPLRHQHAAMPPPPPHLPGSCSSPRKPSTRCSRDCAADSAASERRRTTSHLGSRAVRVCWGGQGRPSGERLVHSTLAAAEPPRRRLACSAPGDTRAGDWDTACAAAVR